MLVFVIVFHQRARLPQSHRFARVMEDVCGATATYLYEQRGAAEQDGQAARSFTGLGAKDAPTAAAVTICKRDTSCDG